MTELAVSRPQCLELPIPSILVRKGRRPSVPPVRVPELATPAFAGIRGHGDVRHRASLGKQVGGVPSDHSLDSDLDELRLERLGLEYRLPDLRREVAAMRGRLARLRREIRAAEVERDGLLVMAAALREHLAETSDQTEQDPEELPALRREVQALPRSNSELQGPRAGFGFPTRFLRIGTWTGRQRFDDS